MEAVEWLDLVNEQDEVIGRATRDEAWETKCLIRGVNAFIVNSKGQLWIPRRTAHKKMFLNCLDVSAGGHVDSGETYEEAFKREAWEELQLNVDAVPWQEKAYFSPLQTGLSLFMRVYEIRSDLAPDYNPDDFTETFWLTPAQVLERIAGGDPNRRDSAKGDLAELIRLCYTGE